jgi:hypothetical protein
MRKRLIWTLALGAIAAVAFAAVAIAAKPTVVRQGNLILTVNGDFSPKKLSKTKLTPIKVNISGKIETSDGTHPPALKEVIAEFDKNTAVNVKGLPVCPQGKLIAQDTKHAKAACPNAIVGEGSTEVKVEFPEQKPFTAKGPLVFFNGGQKGGKITLFIHAYVAVPAPTALITQIAITKTHNGRYGIKTVSKIPVIAGGSGSVISFSFTVNRRFTYKGKQQSYASAKCPDGHINSRISKALFSNGLNLTGTVLRTCTPKG